MAPTRQHARCVALALVLALVSSFSAFAQERQAPRVRVTLLQVNDVYQFLPVERGAHGGLARVMTLRKQIARESPNTLFLLAGDTISPSVESITYKGRQMIDAWNAVGLDYSVFGNHEFDFGPEVLRERVRESKFKWLGANVIDKKTGRPFADTPPFEVREFGGVKLGLFGIVLPETKTTSSPGPDVDFLGACATANQIIPRLRAAGATAIVALTHLSLREDKELAHCAPGLDLIIGGHEHTLLQSSANGVPIFKMTADGREMGRFDLNLDAQTGRVESIDWQVIPVGADTPEDPEFAAAVEPYAGRLKELAAVVGRTEVALDVRSAVNRTRETNVADFVADAFRASTGADIGFVNGGSLRADTVITPGDLTLRDVLSILPFNNPLSKIEVTGAVLLEALEHGVSRTCPGSEPGSFPQVSGLTFSFDASKLPGVRVRDVTVAGKPLDPKKTYTLTTTSFVANGGDQYVMFKGRKNLLADKLVDAEVVRRAIEAAKVIRPQTEGRIRRLDDPARAAPCPAPTPAAAK